jgi:hypothetical protein
MVALDICVGFLLLLLRNDRLCVCIAAVILQDILHGKTDNKCNGLHNQGYKQQVAEYVGVCHNNLSARL